MILFSLLLTISVVLYFLLKKNKPTEKTAATSLSVWDKIINLYGLDYAQQIEQLFRLETGHFKSGQYKKYNSPGMVANSLTYPYGWNSLKQWANENEVSKSEFFAEPYSNGFKYVGFKNKDNAVLFTAWFLYYKRNKNVNSWYSLDVNDQTEYAQKLNGVKTIFTNG